MFSGITETTPLRNKLINLILSSLYNKKFLKKFILLVLLIHIIEFLILTQLVTTINEKITFEEAVELLANKRRKKK